MWKVLFLIAATSCAASVSAETIVPRDVCIDAALTVAAGTHPPELSQMIEHCNRDAACHDANLTAKAVTGKDWFSCRKSTSTDNRAGSEGSPSEEACKVLELAGENKSKWEASDRETIIQQCNGAGAFCRSARKAIVDKEGSTIPGLTRDD